MVFNTGIPVGPAAWTGRDGITVCMSCAANEDGYQVTVTDGAQNACGASIACVNFDALDPAGTGRSPHMTGMNMVFEHPGVGWGREVYWTLDSNLMSDAVPDPMADGVFYYIGALSVHEFGHTLNVGDFEYSRVFRDKVAVMRDPYNNMSPTEEDRRHVRAVYYNHVMHDLR